VDTWNDPRRFSGSRIEPLAKVDTSPVTEHAICDTARLSVNDVLATAKEVHFACRKNWRILNRFPAIMRCRRLTLFAGKLAFGVEQISQAARGFRNPHESSITKETILYELGRIKWFLWHGDVFKADEALTDLTDEIHGALEETRAA